VLVIEERLKKKLKKDGYKKFRLQEPTMGLNIIAGFSVQDTLDRQANKSISDLKKILKSALLKTN
jgi:hypothetical protein